MITQRRATHERRAQACERVLYGYILTSILLTVLVSFPQTKYGPSVASAEAVKVEIRK